MQAEAAIERGQAKVAELEAAGVARTREYDLVVEELRTSAAQSAGELRAAGAQLAKMAEYFEFELATRGEIAAPRSAEQLAFDERPLQVP